MSRRVITSPYDDYSIDYSETELIRMYMREGKSEEEAKSLAEPLAKEMHRLSMAEYRSWFDNKKFKAKEYDGTDMVVGVAGEGEPESG